MSADQPAAGWQVRYHVPRSQVWGGSRGGQTGAIHLHAPETVTLTAKQGRGGTLKVGSGGALCQRIGWYERPVEHESDLRVRCAECDRRAQRYGIQWPDVDTLIAQERRR